MADDDYYEDDEEDDPDVLKDPLYQIDLQVKLYRWIYRNWPRRISDAFYLFFILEINGFPNPNSQGCFTLGVVCLI